eukprot:5595742-Amphidinium_carterae.1
MGAAALRCADLVQMCSKHLLSHYTTALLHRSSSPEGLRLPSHMGSLGMAARGTESPSAAGHVHLHNALL